jgi:hypothetical protein
MQQFLGDRDIKSAMRCVNIDGKEASRLMRQRKADSRLAPGKLLLHG